MNYKLCPICGVNVIPENEETCALCGTKMHLSSSTQTPPINAGQQGLCELNPGTVLGNTQLSLLFRCSTLGGMRRSHRTNTLVLIKNREGVYDDIWKGDICYYTGMGLSGDQDFYYRQNRTLYCSGASGIAVHLFEGSPAKSFGSSGFIYTYIGPVVLAGQPYYDKQKDIHDDDRRVCIFPLRLKKAPNDRGDFISNCPPTY